MTSRNLWPYPKIVVHRLAGVLAPENTMAALRQADACRWRAVETDVMLASDGVLMLSHDENLGRAVRAQGSVASKTSRELQQLDAGILFSEAYRGEPMALFGDALAYCLAHDVWMNIEIKPALGFALQTAQALARELPANLPQGRVLVSSFNEEALAAFAALRADVHCGVLFESDNDDWLLTAEKVHARTVHPHSSLVTEELVRKAHAAGLGIMAWCVNTPEEAERLLALGADALCTDRPDLLHSA